MKQIVSIVLTVHLVLFVLAVFAAPKKKELRKPMKIKTVIRTPTIEPSRMPPEVVVQKKRIAPLPDKSAQLKKVKAKKQAMTSLHKHRAKKQTARPKISAKLLKELEENIAKIEKTRHKGSSRSQLKAPKAIPKLTIEGASRDKVGYAGRLVSCLQRNLVLVEDGEVKGKLIIDRSGQLKSFVVIKSGSLRNERYLSRELSQICYPPFTGDLENHQECTFVISFFHD